MNSLINSIYAPKPFSVANGGTANSTALTNGQFWIGNSGNPPSIGTLTAGAGVSISNGAGTITIAATMARATVLPPLGIPTPLVAGTIVIPTNSVPTDSVCPLILPASPTPGDIYQIVGYGTAGWVVLQNSGQVITVGNTQTAPGGAGTVSSTLYTDSIVIYCVTTTNFVANILSGQINVF